MAGRVLPLGDVPDPVFAEAIVGPGLGIDPVRAPTDVVSPVAGLLLKLHPHAFVVVTDSGAGVLVHLGIDTVQLNGAGFTLHADEGNQVAAGQHLISWNPAEIEAGGRSPVCPVIALEATPDQLGDLAQSGDVQPGELLFTWSA
ncbi:MAG: PTS glucose transporter subunit IIA [Actinomycetota bacterium]|nr:PTS glucose transporter subunit IIA [Actinomycetota bacterium]